VTNVDNSWITQIIDYLESEKLPDDLEEAKKPKRVQYVLSISRGTIQKRVHKTYIEGYDQEKRSLHP